MDPRFYPRDLAGYGPEPPHAAWPGEARVAVQFVVNYEEGGERSLLHGDTESEAFLSDIVGAAPLPGVRHMNMESLYDYGARAGFWRLMRLFGDRGLPFTCFAVGMALARNPAAARAMAEAGHEVASHGWRWIDYQYVDEAVEREHIARAYDTIAELTGTPPVGMYQGRTSPHTLRLTLEHGGFLYSADSYADDLPYWDTTLGRPMLMVPYTLDANDMRFATAQGFNSGDQFFAYLRDAFDVLYAEGADRPKMMSIGLHCRLIGRPGRAAALARFLDYVQGHDRVWVCRRADIARHWIDRFPAPA
jgi:putative urate catabolism protein